MNKFQKYHLDYLVHSRKSSSKNKSYDYSEKKISYAEFNKLPSYVQAQYKKAGWSVAEPEMGDPGWFEYASEKSRKEHEKAYKDAVKKQEEEYEKDVQKMQKEANKRAAELKLKAAKSNAAMYDNSFTKAKGYKSNPVNSYLKSKYGREAANVYVVTEQKKYHVYMLNNGKTEYLLLNTYSKESDIPAEYRNSKDLVDLGNGAKVPRYRIIKMK